MERRTFVTALLAGVALAARPIDLFAKTITPKKIEVTYLTADAGIVAIAIWRSHILSGLGVDKPAALANLIETIQSFESEGSPQTETVNLNGLL